MGRMTEYGLLEMTDKKTALRAHLQINFYPPHPRYVVDSTIEGFEKYWDGKIGLEELKEACYLRHVEGLYRYYDGFLNDEEFEDY